MPSTTVTHSNILPVNQPESSAYFATITPGAGAYGFDTAATAALVLNTLNAIITSLNARKVTEVV